MAARNLIPVIVARVAVDRENQNYFVLIKERDGNRVIPMLIGQCEAHAILRGLEGVSFERPLTHDLLLSVIDALGGRLEKVIINDLRNDVFYARLIINRGGEVYSVDARPSDSIAVALLAGCPIYVGNQVMERAGVELPPEAGEMEA